MYAVGDRVLIMEMYGYGLGEEDIARISAVGTGNYADDLWVKFKPDGRDFRVSRYHVLQLPLPQGVK